MKMSRVIISVPLLPKEIRENDWRWCYSIPETTSREDRYGRRERYDLSKPRNYPGLKASAKWNTSKAKETSEATTYALSRQIEMARSHRTLQSLKTTIDHLRPTKEMLTSSYQAQGLTLPIIEKLLQNYESLPAVKISELQQNTLRLALSKVSEGL